MIEELSKGMAKVVALTVLIPSFVCAEPYQPKEISDLTTTEVYDGTLPLGDRHIEYTVSRQSDITNYSKENHSKEHLRYVVDGSYRLLKSYLSSRGVSNRDCRDDYNLHIFVVDKSVLYTPSRFEAYFKQTGNPYNTLWAYYDSTAEIEKNSIILLANIEGQDNDSLFAHEMAHYWWDRLCLGTKFSGGSERFARDYQSYYERNR